LSSYADTTAKPLSRQALHDALLTGRTVTEILLSLTGGPVVVQRQWGATRQIPHAMRRELQLNGDEELSFRRIRLLAAGLDAAQGDLWYVPARLSPPMLRALAATNEPFGGVIAPLGPVRRTLRARICGPDEPFSLEVAALVIASSGVPLAYVEEVFSPDIGD